MIKKLTLYISLVAVALLLSACRTQPIVNLYNQPVPHGLSTNQVKESIQAGGKVVGWRVVQVKPGLLTASISPRGHYADVNIPYSSKNYSIIYKSSRNLLANRNGYIHRNYNRWTGNLNAKIQHELQLSQNKIKS